MFEILQKHDKDIKNEEETLEGRRLMRESRMLSRKPVIITITAAVDVAFFLLFNFIVNMFVAAFTGNLMSSLDALPRLLLPGALLRLGKASLYLYLFLLIVLAIIDIVLIFRLYIANSEEKINIGQRGTMRWTTLDEIKAQYECVPELETEKERKANGFEEKAGIPICRTNNEIYIDNSDTINNLIIGMTGSGKTEMFVYPMIDVYSRSQEKPSIVAIDPSAELFKSTKETLEARGYEVHILNLIDPLSSMGYNPLSYVIDLYDEGKISDAQLMANTIATMIVNPDSSQYSNNHYFYQQGCNLLSAMILAMAEDCLKAEKEEEERGAEKRTDYRKQVNLYSVYRTFSELIAAKKSDTGEVALDRYFMERENGNVAKLKYQSIPTDDPRVKDSIYSTMTSTLLLYVYDNVAKMTVESSFDLEDLGFYKNKDKTEERPPIALFITLPARDRSKDIIASLFINQAYYALTTRCAEDGTCERPVKFVCDEFWILPKINDFAGMVVMNRKYRISFDLVIQSFQQLEEKYREAANTITGNCANQIYLLSSDQETNKKFSEMIGEKTITTVHRTGGYISLDQNWSENAEGRALKNETEINKLHKGECIIVRTRKREDMEGNDITQYPIFNRDETRFKYRYEYLTYFPNATDKSLSEMNHETRSGINLEECHWNTAPFVQKFRAGVSTESGDGEKNERLGDLTGTNRSAIIAMLKDKLGENFVQKNLTANMQIPILIQIIENEKDMSQNDKIAVLKMLDKNYVPNWNIQ